jgi:hypothetical protein
MKPAFLLMMVGALHTPWPEDACRHVADCPELVIPQGTTGQLGLSTNVQSGDAIFIASVGNVAITPPTGSLILRNSNAAGYPAVTAFYKLSDTDVQNGYVNIAAASGTAGQIATVYAQLFRNASANQPDAASPAPGSTSGASPLNIAPPTLTTVTPNAFVLETHRANIGGGRVNFAAPTGFGGLYQKTSLPQMFPIGNLQQAHGVSSSAAAQWTWTGGGSYTADVDVVALRPSVICVDFRTTQATDTLTTSAQGGTGSAAQANGVLTLTPQASDVNSEAVRIPGAWLYVEAICSVAKPTGALQYLTLGLGSGALRGAITATGWNYTVFTNGYAVGLTTTNGISLFKHVSGVRTSLATATLTGSDVFNDGAQNTIRLAIESGRVKVYVNGTAYIDVAETTYTSGLALIAQGRDASDNGGTLSIARLTVKSD